MTKKWWGPLLLGASLFVGACSGDDDGDQPDADAAPPLIDPGYRETYVMARGCRNSASHDLHKIVVWASPDAADAYIPQDGVMPVGSILLKEEYDFADTNCEGEVIRFSVMKKLESGAAPEFFDWYWAAYEADGVTQRSENDSRCYGCHDDCDGEPDRLFENTCAVP